MIQMTFKSAVLLSRDGFNRSEAQLAALAAQKSTRRERHKQQPILAGSRGPTPRGGAGLPSLC